MNNRQTNITSSKHSLVLPPINSNLSSVIAVHGLGGHWQTTWTDENGSLWLRDFLPSQLRNTEDARINPRIMSYGYNSNTAFSRAVTNIEVEAEALLDRMDGNRERDGEKSRPIIFIAHSLGGLIVKKVCPDLYQSTSEPPPLSGTQFVSFG